MLIKKDWLQLFPYLVDLWDESLWLTCQFHYLRVIILSTVELLPSFWRSLLIKLQHSLKLLQDQMVWLLTRLILELRMFEKDLLEFIEDMDA